MDSLPEKLWSGSAEIADRCLQHPFVRGLADGTLSSERYSTFIAQDAFFLRAFARGYAAGVARASDSSDQRLFHDLQVGVFDELKLHTGVSTELGIDIENVVPLEATQGYTDFLLANAFTGSLAELIASMTPCMRLYLHLGEQIASENHPDHAYTGWVRTYSSNEFADLVDQLEGLLDKHARDTEREMARYQRAMEWEFRFFDEAWRSEG